MGTFRIDKFSGIRDEVVALDPSSLETCVNFDLTDDNKLKRRFGIGYFDPTYGFVSVGAEPYAASPILKILNAGTHSYDSGGGVYKSIDEILVFRKDGKIALLRQNGWTWVKSLGGFHYWDSATYGNLKSFTISKFRDLYLISANKDISTPQDVTLPQTVILYKQASTGAWVFVSAGLDEATTSASFTPQTGGAIGPLSWTWHRQFDFTTFDGVTYQITGSIYSGTTLNNFLSPATNLTGLITATINTSNVPSALLHYPPVGATNKLKIYRTASAGSFHSLFHDVQITSPTTSITPATPVVAAALAVPLYTDTGEVSDNIAPINLTRAATCITDNGVAWALDYKNKILRQAKAGAIYSWPVQFEQGLKNDVKCIASVGQYPILFSETSIDRCEGFLDTQGLGYTEIKSVSTQIGTRFQDAIVKVDNKLYFIASNGVYVTDGFTVQPLSTSINSVLDLMTVHPNEIRGHYDGHENKIYWVSSIDYVLVYHLNAAIPGFTIYKSSQGIFSSVGSFLDNEEVGSPRARSNKGKRLLVGTTNSFLGFLKNETDTYNTCDTITLANTGVENPFYSEPIEHEFLTNPTDLGAVNATKWIPKVVIGFKKLSANLAVGFNSKNNRKTSFKLKLLNYSDSLLNNFKLVKRHFPKTFLRATYKQVGVNVERTTIVDETSGNSFFVKPLVSSTELHYASGVFPGDYDTNYGGFDVECKFKSPDWKTTLRLNYTSTLLAQSSTIVTGVSYVPINSGMSSVFKDTQGGLIYAGYFAGTTSMSFGFLVSKDGANWQIVSTKKITGLRNVVYGNGVFVSIALTDGTSPSLGRAAVSTDGYYWEIYPTDTSGGFWESVAFGNGKFVAVGTKSGTRVAMTSTDGKTWVTVATGLGVGYSKICFGDGKFVAISTGNVNPRIKYSYDGVTWAGVTMPSIFLSDIVYNGSIFVVVSSSGTFGVTRAMYSYNGIEWYESTSEPAQKSYSALAYGNGVFVAIGVNGVQYSLDGKVWNFVSGPRGVSIAFGNGLFIAHYIQTNTGTFEQWSSSDGITWVMTVLNPRFPSSTISYANGIFIATGTPTNIEQMLRLNNKRYIDTTTVLNVNSTKKPLPEGFNVGASFSDGSFVLSSSSFDPVEPLKIFYKFNAQGILDPSFAPTAFLFYGFINSMIVVNDNLYVAGDLTTYEGVSCRKIFKLNSAGVLDTVFNTNIASVTPSVDSASPTGLVYNPLTGYIHFILGNNISCIDLNGNFIASWAYLADASVTSIIPSPLFPEIYVTGNFANIGGLACTRVALLTGNGARSSAFQTGIGSSTTATISDGVIRNNSLYLVGNMTTFNGIANRGLVKLSLMGAQDNAVAAAGVASWPTTLTSVHKILYDDVTDTFTLYPINYTFYNMTDTVAAGYTNYPILTMNQVAIIDASTGGITNKSRVEYGKIFGFVPEEWAVIGYPKNTSFIVDSVEYDFASMGEGYKDSKEDGGLD